VSVGSRANLHILHVVPTLGPGGMELAMSRVVRELSKRGMRHSIACLKGEPVIRDQFDDSVGIYCLHTGSNDLRLPWRLRKLICDIRPTVIHARNWGAWPDVALARLTVRPRVPLVFSFHGADSPGPMPFRRRLAFRILAPLTTRFFTVSEASRRRLAEETGVPANSIDVIPNGVDTDRFVPSMSKPKTSRLVVGSVGSLTSVKNHAMLIETCAELLRDGIDLELRIAGKGPLDVFLHQQAATLGIADRVTLYGHVNDVPQFLQTLDVFGLSSDSEAHPNALLEAMACGLACVATRVGGVAEVLDYGRCGLLAEPGNRTALSGAIRRVLLDQNLRQELGKYARLRVVNHCGLKQMVENYDSLYRSTSRQQDVIPGERTLNGRSTDPRRILMLGPLPPPAGGMATVMENLRTSVLTEKCCLTVLNNGKTTPQDRSLVRGVAAQVRLLARLARCIRHERAKIVHIHTCSGFTFWRDSLHALAARVLGCRVIWHVHGARFDEFFGSLRNVSRWLSRRALRSAGAVIVLGPSWEDKLRDLAPGAAWRIVPNGVPIPPARPWNNGNRQFTVLYLSSLDPRKGPRDLVSAAALAFNSGLTGAVVLAGSETERGQKDALLGRIAECGCDSRVRLVGAVSGPEKERVLVDADCFVLPSYAEGLPMAMLEAMAYGMPVIVTRVGAIPEVVTDGVEGFLIEPGDVKALADRLLQMERDPTLRHRMGLAARKRVEQDYSIETMIERLLAIYDQVLTGTKD
jgi:glycosyltransferase involved in cell wall biosynthesis